MRLNPELVKNALAGHSWVGLLVGGLMYAICLSGALLVFHPELERWEQPNVPEVSSVDPAGMEEMFNAYLASGEPIPPHMYLVLPTSKLPRARLATANDSWFLHADGSIGPKERIPWSEMLMDLHLYLHLPNSWGMLVVSITGVMLVALIITGLLAHPKLFRDAFSLRFGGSKQLEQTDIHNRLSVWGAPFYLVIAITGAYFGLATPTLNLYADAQFDGDRGKVVSMLFGEEPELNEGLTRIATARAIEKVRSVGPGVEPFMLILHDSGEPNQHMSISALHPNRLVYSENYVFAADGRFLRSDGFTDGPVGKQIVYSIYRLHFGHFAGYLVQWVYLVLGLGLAVVSATGINVWLARRRKRDLLEDIWVGFVWGLPLALVVSVLVSLLVDMPPAVVVWGSLVVVIAVCAGWKDVGRSRAALRLLLCLATLLLVIAQIAVFGSNALSGAAAAVNAVLAMVALLGLATLRWWIPTSQRVVPRA